MKAAVLIFAIIMPTLLFAQEQDSAWSVIFTEPNTEVCYNVVRGPDRDIWMAGTWYNTSPGFGDWFVVRLDSMHVETNRWRLETTDGGICYNVLPLDANLTVLFGLTSSYNTVIIRAWTDAGLQLWETHLPGGYINLTAGARASDNTFLLCGHRSQGGPIANCLIKMSITGDTLWTRTYHAAMINYTFDMIAASHGGYLLVGKQTELSPFHYGVEILKVNEDGDSLWCRTYSHGPDWDVAQSVIEVGGQYWIAGFTRNFGNSHGDGLLLRVDSLGNEIQALPLQPLGFETAMNQFYKIVRASANEIVLVGESDVWDSSTVYSWMVGVDTMANVLWSRIYGNGTCRLYGAAPGDSGGLLLSGENWSSGRSDFWLMGTRSEPISPNSAPDLVAPQRYTLSQNYPNPFNPTTRISFALPKTGKAELKVYDLLGREVATLLNGNSAAGEHTVPFDGSGLASGIYFYRLESGAFSATRKMLLLK